MKIPAQPKVILRSCREYDAEKIRQIIREGLEELGLKPTGRTLVKPNLVAAGPLFPYAYTRPEFGEGVLRALRDVAGPEMTELAAGERCGITVPTRVAFRESGWDAMLKKIGSATRFEIERVLGRKVFLDLWVKVRKDWRSDPASLRWLGYDLKRHG